MKLLIIFNLISNFDNQIIPIFAKLQNMELATFCRALIGRRVFVQVSHDISFKNFEQYSAILVLF